jgi:hypothetical protein
MNPPHLQEDLQTTDYIWSYAVIVNIFNKPERKRCVLTARKAEPSSIASRKAVRSQIIMPVSEFEH